MPAEVHPASTKETAFDCPHCGAYTSQQWYQLFSRRNPEDEKLPLLPNQDALDELERDSRYKPEAKEGIIDWMKNVIGGLVFLNEEENAPYCKHHVYNLFLSKCYNCGKLAVWVHDSLLFPAKRFGANPNGDLPKEIIADYEEARSIVSLSPRGASALLRLSIQKLCKHLGGTGKNLDDDIAALVSSELSQFSGLR